jgi:ABC-type nitrate/sulfonate/bicarbonate transport system ATPase subunit
MKLIEMIDVSRSFGEGELKIDALKKTNIAIEAGEFVAVIGPVRKEYFFDYYRRAADPNFR